MSNEICGSENVPVITIEVVPLDYAKKAEIAKTFTEEFSKVTKIAKESIVVLFHELPLENVSSGGQMLSEKYKK
jgi:phenylpyruvate tautomerase PptA (4-oxalocrotonate tautomerase family)